ncbi:MAG TPA: hypothetical protein VJ142_02170 [Candidatus Nanoarchaeia archaeon]|nr:hypothetical protein [Candidatus Nanoarchaeia archaeon]
MYSIYHFFHSLFQQKHLLKKVKKLDKFPFNKNLLSCRNEGIFPDMAIRLNKDKSIFIGGELIELKDSDSYTVSSFNSTIPSRSKKIEDIITGENSIIKQQMEEAGNDIFSLPIRDVYYLVRGRKKSHTKICLVYGSFFETISIENLISQSFSQVLEERLKESEKEVSDEFKQTLLSIFSQQENFSKVRNVEKASVKLRFRIMTEVKAEGNILNSKKYPEIEDNTLNFVLPCHNDEDGKNILRKAEIVFGKSELKQFKIFKIKHHFNGYFLALQTSI